MQAISLIKAFTVPSPNSQDEILRIGIPSWRSLTRATGTKRIAKGIGVMAGRNEPNR